MRIQGVGTLVFAALLTAACNNNSDEVPNYAALEKFVAKHQVGADQDWIEMKNLSGEWERVGLVFGFMGDYDECLKAIAGLKKVNFAREYRCSAANKNPST